LLWQPKHIRLAVFFDDLPAGQTVEIHSLQHDCLLVGGTPKKVPRCAPRIVKRALLVRGASAATRGFIHVGMSDARAPPSFRAGGLLGRVSFGLAARIWFRIDSRQQYALGRHSAAIFLPWKQRTSARRRGKDMLYFGKVLFKMTVWWWCVVSLGLPLVANWDSQHQRAEA
jgi:hypothetical protein